jgi:hypothetical protein
MKQHAFMLYILSVGLRGVEMPHNSLMCNNDDDVRLSAMRKDFYQLPTFDMTKRIFNANYSI